MSFPNLPNITPTININTGQVINLLLASIAFEELSLAHIINAEAEKLQFVLGHNPNLNQLLVVNKNIEQTLRTVIKQQMLLQFKLEDVLELSETPIPIPPPPTPCGCQVDTFCIRRGVGANDTTVVFNGETLPSNRHGPVEYGGYLCKACSSDNAFAFTYGGTSEVPAFQFSATTFNVPGCPYQTVTITGEGTTNNQALFGASVTYTLVLNGVLNDKSITLKITGSNGNTFTTTTINLGNGELDVSNCP